MKLNRHNYLVLSLGNCTIKTVHWDWPKKIMQGKIDTAIIVLALKYIFFRNLWNIFCRQMVQLSCLYQPECIVFVQKKILEKPSVGLHPSSPYSSSFIKINDTFSFLM